ncbi:acyl carrier protein [Streptomyces broussonetiae]|uniref:acyl carrier protein n=1 Tax=Streptomyces broussonetiae TaxID=2686304 RepID=UPI0035DC27EB
MTENTTSTGTDSPLATEAVVRKLEDAVAVDRPRRDLRLTDSISQDIRLDSLALLEVLTRIEEEFGIDLIDAPDTYSATTVQDLVTLIQTRAAAVDTQPAAGSS